MHLAAGVSPWHGCFDALADHLADQRAALAAGRFEDVRPFSAPLDLGPVPPALASRLTALADENAALTADLELATASCARQLQLMTVLHRPEPSTASFVDSRG